LNIANSKTRSLGAGPSLISRIPKPFSGSEGADYLYLIILATLQTAILPTLLPDYLMIDILTPWITLVFICKKSSSAVIQGFLAAILIETHSATPAGLYICSYWILGTAVTLLRGSMAWHSRVSWVSLIILAQSWVFVTEFFVSFIESQALPTDIYFYIGQGFRIIFAAVFGMFLFQNLRPTPQKGGR